MSSRENILGVAVSAINMQQALERMAGWIGQGQPNYICVAAAHSLMACRRQPDLKQIFNQAAMVTPDGMPLVWLLRGRGHRHVRRVYGPDLMLAAISHLDARHFLYGGGPGVAQELKEQLRARWPEAHIVGTYSPPFRSLTKVEEGEIAALVRRSGADIVWVGLGTGKQERWMADHVGQLSAPVLVGVGAAFDFLSGRKAQAPRWLRTAGLEWFYRLLHEPRRLRRRYSEYPLFVGLTLLQLLGWRQFPLIGYQIKGDE